ncbi:MAG: protoheme IX farnesyltransferase [Candidatus Viridilinea halotolerans]|uniref:Protoheme IX farnesyltransferase n=1 Tax=Candidatus Viridilinea halotolerans TaxID=2491704 RepID=A0A426TTK2_9CHLR|nr:MAG: protoheme IX farnesyltransferase [Candidatus Viridilinea halotolerans]
MFNSNIARIAPVGALFTLLVVVSGGLVSASGSGAACSGWPLCSEAFTATATPQIWLAGSHRVLVLLAMLFAAVAATLALLRPALGRTTRVLLMLAPIFGLLQLGIDGLMARLGFAIAADLSHLALALLMLGCQTLAALRLILPVANERLGGRALRETRRLTTLAWWTAGAVAVLTLALSSRAALVPSVSAATLLPANGSGALAMASLFATGTLWQTWRTRRNDRLLLAGASLIVLLLVSLAPLYLLPNAAGAMVGLAASLWVATLALAVVIQRRPLPAHPNAIVAPVAAERTPSLLIDYLSLTKPKVISLLLVTTASAMYITEAGMPSLWLVFWTMVGGYLAAGGAGAINCAFDSDIDINMGRTSRRPVPSGRISRRSALRFGLALSALSVVVLLAFTTPLAALCSTLGIGYYAWLYTRWLKRSTWQNIIVGGGAGAIPPLVGWTAVTGTLSVAPLLLFAIVFYWTPPHFWALALVKQKDYTRAGVPMLPVVAGEAETRWQMLVYSILMVALSLLLTPIGAMGWLYFAAAVGFGVIFLSYAWAVWRRGDHASIWGLYKYSLLYLALLFVAMVVDRLT